MRDEAALSFLIRIAAVNGFESPEGLRAAILTAAHRSLRKKVSVESLLQDSDAQEPGLFGPGLRSWVRHGVPFFANNHFNKISMRWCARCLKDKEYLRQEWVLKFSCVCSVHRLLLCDRCPSCMSLQSLQRASLQKCICGTRLSVAPSLKVSPDVVTVSNFLNYAVVCQTRVHKGLQLDPYAWHQFVRRFGRLEGRLNAELDATCRSLPAVIGLLRSTSAVLAGSSERFKKSISNFVTSGAVSKAEGKALFRLSIFLRGDIADPRFRFLISQGSRFSY